MSIDVHGNPALRMALQTQRTTHQTRKGYINICTAQALLANMASMYAVYHGQEGLKEIAQSIHDKTAQLAQALSALGLSRVNKHHFDTLHCPSQMRSQKKLKKETTESYQINLFLLPWKKVTISLGMKQSLQKICTIW